MGVAVADLEEKRGTYAWDGSTTLGWYTLKIYTGFVLFGYV